MGQRGPASVNFVLEVPMLSLFRKKKQAPSLKAVFFDLDGTLLDVEMNAFIAAYVEGLSRHFSDIALRFTFNAALREAMLALLAGDSGYENNETLFYAVLKEHLGIGADLFLTRLRTYCDSDLEELKSFVRPLPLARQILEQCRTRNLAMVLATNPVFPRPIVDARLAWGQLAGVPFDLVTSIENTRYCKPDPRYFKDILDYLGCAPEEALMVGNDTEHDLAARAVGIPTFLVDTWLVDRGAAFQPDYRGNHQQLLQFLSKGTQSGASENAYRFT